eukprot:3935043-Rhodomonas_salina.2
MHHQLPRERVLQFQDGRHHVVEEGEYVVRPPRAGAELHEGLLGQLRDTLPADLIPTLRGPTGQDADTDPRDVEDGEEGIRRTRDGLIQGEIGVKYAVRDVSEQVRERGRDQCRERLNLVRLRAPEVGHDQVFRLTHHHVGRVVREIDGHVRGHHPRGQVYHELQDLVDTNPDRLVHHDAPLEGVLQQASPHAGRALQVHHAADAARDRALLRRVAQLLR